MKESSCISKTVQWSRHSWINKSKTEGLLGKTIGSNPNDVFSKQEHTAIPNPCKYTSDWPEQMFEIRQIKMGEKAARWQSSPSRKQVSATGSGSLKFVDLMSWLCCFHYFSESVEHTYKFSCKLATARQPSLIGVVYTTLLWKKPR